MRLTEGRCVALLGPLGSGKSSVLNVVRTLLRGSEPTTILVDFDVWAVPRAEEVPRLALDRIVEALDNHVDTIALRDVPTTYQRLVAAAPISNLSRALGVDTESDSTETLQRLNEILGALDARLVLIVEDAERTGKTFDTRHLQRLLWAPPRGAHHQFCSCVRPKSRPWHRFRQVVRHRRTSPTPWTTPMSLRSCWRPWTTGLPSIQTLIPTRSGRKNYSCRMPRKVA